jgi:hypothetical protein
MIFKKPKYQLGLRWRKLDLGEACCGIEIKNQLLADALRGRVKFKKEQWDAFQVENLSADSYVNTGNGCFKPAAEEMVLWVKGGE